MVLSYMICCIWFPHEYLLKLRMIYSMFSLWWSIVRFLGWTSVVSYVQDIYFVFWICLKKQDQVWSDQWSYLGSFALTLLFKSIYLVKDNGWSFKCMPMSMQLLMCYLFMHALNFYLHLKEMLINSQCYFYRINFYNVVVRKRVVTHKPDTEVSVVLFWLILWGFKAAFQFSLYS